MSQDMRQMTGLGRNIRAAVSDPELLSVSGVDVARLYTTVFVIGAGLAALGGAIVAPSQAVGPTMDTDVLVLAFAISVIGGLGSIVGSVVGALVVGSLLIPVGEAFLMKPLDGPRLQAVLGQLDSA